MEVRTHSLTGLRYVLDTSVPEQQRAHVPCIVAREGSDGVWRPTAGNGIKTARAALAAAGITGVEVQR